MPVFNFELTALLVVGVEVLGAVFVNFPVTTVFSIDVTDSIVTAILSGRLPLRFATQLMGFVGCEGTLGVETCRAICFVPIANLESFGMIEGLFVEELVDVLCSDS